MLDDAIDRIKTSNEPEELILVGGGSVIVPKTAVFKGISTVVIPNQYAGNANALGAAIS